MFITIRMWYFYRSIFIYLEAIIYIVMVKYHYISLNIYIYWISLKNFSKQHYYIYIGIKIYINLYVII